MTARLCLVAALGLLAGCAEQLDHLGRPPTLTAPGAPTDVVAAPSPERVALIPPPPPPPNTAVTASLWTSGPRSLFGDRRAKRRGDILTVAIEIDDEAELENSTTRDRTGTEDLAIQAFYGLPALADSLLPGGGTLNPAVGTNSSTSTTGVGQITRNEKITLQLAATVIDVLPNGHLVVRGSQEVRVNYELRDLEITGIVRPEDISRQNEITYEKIADARIVYGGRGQITDLQQPRIGQQVFDLISPF